MLLGGHTKVKLGATVKVEETTEMGRVVEVLCTLSHNALLLWYSITCSISLVVAALCLKT